MASKNPVEQRIALMRDLWLEATADERVRVVVWRVPDNAQRMLLAFYEMQRHDGDWRTPDLFVRFDQPFETGFGYSRALCDAVIEGYVESRESFEQQGIAFDWPFGTAPRADSPAGFVALFGSFARHHAAHHRHAVAALVPPRVSTPAAFEAWVRGVVQPGLPDGLRLSLVDTAREPRWSRLADDHAALVRVIEPPIDLFDVARETAAQSGGAGPAVAYRQMLADALTLVEKGTPAQTAARADKALAVAVREGWFDQQVVLHMAVAGAHLKAKDHPEAIRHYRLARGCGDQAAAQGNPVGSTLVMQAWFGEAGAWLGAGQPRHAAQAYGNAAEQAQRVPNALFAVEGFRMAGYCLVQARDIEAARDHLVLAVREGKAIAPQERAQTTLPIALNDLLRLHDAARVAQLEALAQRYQADIASAHERAEQQAAALGARPANAQVDRIEADMNAAFETAFDGLRTQRERVIAAGDEFFRKVVGLGRELLHPQWAGLPEVKHPLDADTAAWTRLPAMAELPPAGGFPSPRTEATA